MSEKTFGTDRMAQTVIWVTFRDAASHPFSQKTMVESGRANRKNESRKLGSSVESLKC